MRRINCSLVSGLDPLDIRLCATNSDIIYDRTHITGCTLILDGKALVDPYFENCIIIYRGGPAKITNTAFKNCLFEFTLSQPASPLSGKALAEKILVSSAEQPYFVISTE